MRLSAWMLAAALLGCAPPRPTSVRVAVVVQDERGAPLANVHVWLDGRDAGATDTRGRLLMDRHARRGDTTAAAITCPVGRRAEPPTRTVALKTTRNAAGEPLPIEVSFTCAALAKTAPLVVVATGPGNLSFPVHVDDEVVAQTDASGTAHTIVDTTPGTVLRVRIDTSSRSDLRPASPSLVVPVESSDTILLATQHFEPAPLRAGSTRSGGSRRPRALEQRHRPYRIH